MDVAKYIGLFLLKNHFCYIHGLGNLELRKKPATYDGAALQAPSYEVVVTPAGSIDDNLANFIATNEQTSISKAANALRDFSIQARADLQAGKEVPIPHIGKFAEENGKILFITDPHLQYTPPGIPTLRASRRVEEDREKYDNAQQQQQKPVQPVYNPVNYEPSSTTSDSGGSLNWGRVILAAVVLIVIIALAVFGYKYVKEHHNKISPPTPPITDSALNRPKVDTAQVRRDSVAVAAINSDTVTTTYQMVIDTYPTRKKAMERVVKMKNYGHGDLNIIAKDSSTYLVIMPVKCAPADTTKVMDSLSRDFNPAGITIYQ
jgi:hypothetical protein